MRPAETHREASRSTSSPRASFLGDRLCCLLLAAFSLLLFASLARYGLNIGEEGATVHLFGRTARGEVPYVDFISGYTPGYFYFHAALLAFLGESVMAVRWPLVAVHTANVLLLYAMGRTLLPRPWAVLAALAYPASLPVVEASELSFNVPYPAWYTLLFLSLGFFTTRAALSRGHLLLWALAGALAGLSFSFKPNSGLFHLSFVALAATLGSRNGQPEAWPVLRARHAVPGAVLAGIAAVLRHHWTGRELLVFFLPLCGIVAALLIRPLHAAPAGDRPRAALPALLATAAGFAALTFPWLLWWWGALGTQRFLHDVLFIGTGYERFFYEPYRASARQLSIALLVAAAAWGIPGAAKSVRSLRRLAWLVAVAALAAGLGHALLAEPPEGFVAACISAWQSAWFLLVPVAHGWSAVHLWRSGGRGDPSRSAFALLALAAQCSWLNAYPRSDFFHVAYAAPLSGIVVAYALREYALRWSALLPLLWQRRAGRLVWVGVATMLVVVAVPHGRIAGRVLATALGFEAGLERLGVQGAPVLIQRGPAGNRQRDLAATVAYLRSAGERGAWLLTFPDLELVTFLAGLRSPARIGYFKAGWPAHRVEAEVVDSLRERRPRWIVSEDPVSLFFYDAPAYFFLLRHWVQQHYRPVHRFGTFVVFEEVAGNEPEGRADEPVMPVAQGLPSEAQGTCARPALRRLREEGNVALARQWAESWARVGRDAWPPACARFALRVVGEVGDAHAARSLFRGGPPRDPAVAQEWEGALWNLALRGILRRFHWAARDQRAAERRAWSGLEAREGERLVEWLSDSRGGARRLVAAWALAASGDGGLVALPSGEAIVDLLSRAVLLVERPTEAQAWVEVLRRVDELPNLLPALFLEWAQSNSERAWQVWAEAYRAAPPSSQEELAYIAAVLTVSEACSRLQAEERTEAREAVRAALGWSLRALQQRGVCTLGGLSR